MHMRGWTCALLGALTAAAACSKKEEGGSPTPSPAPGSATKAITTAATVKATGAEAPSAPARVPSAAASFKLPPGRTPVPTLEEWDKQKREVTVKGSSALKCETKMVREYLRVSCNGKNDSGGTPTGIKLVRGGREAQTFSSGGIASLIVPVVEGTNFEAIFSWTDKSHPLTVKWPKGDKMPTIVGVFEGAKSPLDRSADAMATRLCDCHKKIFKAASCDDLMGSPDEDCERTWGTDCSMLLACSRGEPGAAPSCRQGWVHTPPLLHCNLLCGAGKPACPAGSSCQQAYDDVMVCMLD